jgi:hypothetical protein
MAGDVVPAAAHRDQQPLVTRQAHGGHNILDSGAAGDQGRSPLDHPVPDGTGVVILCIVWADQLAAQAGGEALHGRLVK